MSKARIAFGNALFDSTQPATLKVVQVDGKLQLVVSLGLIATEVPDSNTATPDEVLRFRDAAINSNLAISGSASISMVSRGVAEKTANFTVVLTSLADTKIPGTGDEFRFDKVVLKEFASINGG